VAGYSAATMLMMIFYIRWLLKLTKGINRAATSDN
jgi:hypothetical protein